LHKYAKKAQIDFAVFQIINPSFILISSNSRQQLNFIKPMKNQLYSRKILSTKGISLSLFFLLCILTACNDQINPSIPPNAKLQEFLSTSNLKYEPNKNLTEHNSITFNSDNELIEFLNSIESNNSQKVNTYISRFKGKNLRKDEDSEVPFDYSSFKLKKIDSLKFANNFILPCPNQNGGFIGSTDFGFGTLNFAITTSISRIDEIDSFLSGWTFGTSYTYGGYINYGVTPTGDIKFIIYGTENYDVFFQGAGTLYRHFQQHDVVIKCNGQVFVTARE
jgi:hypothetical protein